MPEPPKSAPPKAPKAPKATKAPKEAPPPAPAPRLQVIHDLVKAEPKSDAPEPAPEPKAEEPKPEAPARPKKTTVMSELWKQAKSQGMKGYNKMTRAQLESALNPT